MLKPLDIAMFRSLITATNEKMKEAQEQLRSCSLFIVFSFELENFK